MALMTRLSRMFRADIHAVLDRIEEPLQLLQQAIREMDEALLQEQQRLKLYRYDQHQLQRRLDGLQQRLARCDEELDICFNSGQEALARSTVKRRLETERLGKMLAQQEAALGEQIRPLEARIEQHRAELEGMRQKAELMSHAQTDGRPCVTAEGIGVAVGEDEIEVAFLREKQRRMPS